MRGGVALMTWMFGALGPVFGATVVLEPEAKTEPLFNPGKGWSARGQTSPDELVEWIGMGVRRFEWSQLEPREGQFEWKMMEDFLNWYASRGKVCNVGIMCASTHSRSKDGFVTPAWVFEAGAQKFDVELPADRPDLGPAGNKVMPVFDDVVFLEKWRAFVKAFAERYDGDPRIAVLDIRSYGNWGEGHLYPFNVLNKAIKDISPAKIREHVLIQTEAFKKTRLGFSCESARPDRVEIYDWAVKELKVAPRRDGICGNSNGSETLRGVGYAPAVFEMYGPYKDMKKKGWWDGIRDARGYGFKLEDCVEKGRPTWVDLGSGEDGVLTVRENLDLVKRLTNRIGYHFHLKRVAFPDRGNGAGRIEFHWENRGVAPVYEPCALAVGLVDEKGELVAVGWPEGSAPGKWESDKVTEEVLELGLRGVGGEVAAGSYRLVVGLSRSREKAEPYIRVGSELPLAQGWMVLGAYELESTLASGK